MSTTNASTRKADRRRRSGRALLAVLATLVATAAWPSGLDAQQRGQGQRGEVDRAQLERRIRAQMGRRMQERLGLDAERSEQLAQVVQGFDARRRELFQQEQATRRQLQDFLRASADDETEARALLTRMAELRLQEAELFREEQEALLEVLTPVQLVRLQELRQELGQRIRALGSGGRGGDVERRRGPGPGPGAFREGPGRTPRSPAGTVERGAQPGPVRIL